MCYDNVINLPNGFAICKRGLFFDLVGDGRSTIVNCNRFDYVSGKLVALERYDVIHVYSMETVDTSFGKEMKEIATFATYLGLEEAKITVDGETYTIRKDCKFYPKE